MTWLKPDDKFAGHPKISPLSEGAFRLHVSGLLYCAGQDSDGRIPVEQVPLLMPRYRPRYRQELVDRGLWHIDGTTVEVHDYLDYNPSRAQINEQREREREKKRRQREAGSAKVTNGHGGRFVPRAVPGGQS